MYGLIRSSLPYFTVTLRKIWLRITIVLLRVVYDDIRSSTGTRKWLLIIIIVGDHCTLSHAYVVYDPRRCITEFVCERKRPNTSIRDTEKYDRNMGPCIPEKYGPDTFLFLNVYNRILSCTNFAALDLGMYLALFLHCYLLDRWKKWMLFDVFRHQATRRDLVCWGLRYTFFESIPVLVQHGRIFILGWVSLRHLVSRTSVRSSARNRVQILTTMKI